VRLLILGGSSFVGHAIACAALDADWEVTTFNRGRSGGQPPGVQMLRGDRTVSADILRVVDAGAWDAVVDTSGYVPVNVQSVARSLESACDRYVFMSTVSVYDGWPVIPLTDESPTLYCPPDAGPEYGEDVEDGHTRYGFQKSGCELAVLETFGRERTTLLRPGVVLGPREYVGRLPWWLNRIAAGGRIVAPGNPERRIQPLDVRDLADLALTCISDGLAGSFNVTSTNAGTFEDMLLGCGSATGVESDLVWVDDETLVRLGVRQWSEMPLWRTHAGVWQVDSSRAIDAGLSCRPLKTTIEDTWQWMQEAPDGPDDARASEVGLSRERERMILEAVS
jgi:2'-hydroxyisoflavone reductase